MSTNILRPPPIEKLRTRDADEKTEQRAALPRHHARNMPLLLVIGALGIAGLIILTARGEWAAAPSPIPAAAMTTPVPMAIASAARETIIVTAIPVPTPSCVSGQGQQALIDGLIQQGKWEEAANQAEAAVSTSNLCPEDIRPLTQRAVLAGVNVLYNQEFAPLDVAGQQQGVDRFLRLRERARLLHVEFPSLLQVARETYRISQHRLTVAALEIALTEGSYNPALNRDATRLYISALYGLGFWYAQAPKDSALYSEGLAYLVASHRLAVTFHTGQAEAATLLRQLAGNDEATWPAPYHSPLLRGQS